ncbi:hypothetical protein A2313_04830 [Candidatus Roizmanbacteria bacterium RIFOXYB2_FULL_41_10]|uniref:Steroid 5-alpha reductase C-terminal domain-containing protein n=1 Tax=Candidatus Roizmanbacteria bacterium RIFOXYA1_FULL_41_12 TaxID=1802082 RepID=A0A1F7K9G9_9BACT|nr:MAG: hypothetical protein A2209_02300 [Candidatus Roizmanbacteria bacterium RIFOXYA1_FULL_41_12]OGK68018.1 MAG: hypothetical protein A2377_03955 [Candidatus Roizmanbacteria bacterium RIFOXYB1_FULL_41_27]OGK69172.1 MAG: hypothetical protein A2313_04830 [Candidatus Roizmanbacteria bacterium RIFOXYB2_FULL_41_10]OGK75438.1 MAG: hypothetical protein A2575_04175 [Candidatus Roizmanbacteria bacterium RIFOXYD1_FULL_41_24]
MKLLTSSLAFLYGLFLLVVFPFLSIRLNEILILPVYSNSIAKFLGIFMIVIGSLIWLICIGIFFYKGKGTPVPINPPRKLVVDSIYKRTRNPMYINTLLVLFGYFLYFGHLSLLCYWFMVFVVFHLFVVFYEEPTLQKKFGENYSKYCRKVPRWI